jgi:hypothetical protein
MEQVYYNLFLTADNNTIWLTKMESFNQVLTALGEIFQILWKHGCVRDGLEFSITVVVGEAGSR